MTIAATQYLNRSTFTSTSGAESWKNYRLQEGFERQEQAKDGGQEREKWTVCGLLWKTEMEGDWKEHVFPFPVIQELHELQELQVLQVLQELQNYTNYTNSRYSGAHYWEPATPIISQ